MQQPSHMLITWVELNQLEAMILQERERFETEY